MRRISFRISSLLDERDVTGILSRRSSAGTGEHAVCSAGETIHIDRRASDPNTESCWRAFSTPVGSLLVPTFRHKALGIPLPLCSQKKGSGEGRFECSRRIEKLLGALTPPLWHSSLCDTPVFLYLCLRELFSDVEPPIDIDHLACDIIRIVGDKVSHYPRYFGGLPESSKRDLGNNFLQYFFGN